jgi:uncharacterized protein (DUF697 family)
VTEARESKPIGVDWRALRRALLRPRPGDRALHEALREARERQPLPVVWLIGKAQSGKTSIVRALTGSPAAEIGNGFRPCTRTARIYDFPEEAPVARFLDTRGLGEVAYDPSEDIRFCESQAHLLLGVMKAMDPGQDAVFEVLRAVRRRHPQWPVIVAQTGLHEGYPRDADHSLPYPFDSEPWPAKVPHDLARALRDQRERLGPLRGDTPPCWVPVDLTLPEDGFPPADYGLDALWSAIGEISSLDLRARLGADPAVRDTLARAAHPHILGYALAAAGVGAIPVPAVDLVGVTAIQAKLLHSLSELYGQSWGRREISELFGLLGLGVGASYATRLIGRSLVKLIPALGQALGAIWGASASGATTYALGKAAAYYFARRRHGGRVDPEAVRQVYQEALESGARLIDRGRARGED